jgi:hypothetical protein
VAQDDLLLAWPICSGKFSHLYIDGGFISLKDHPRDIDIVLQTREPYGPAAFKAIEPFFVIGLDSIRETFTVHLHFWMENAPPGMIDFRSFFASNRRSHLHAAIMPETGLFRISLLEPDIRDIVRREIEAATAH